MNYKTIGVIGHTGMVGGATARYFQKLKDVEVIGHSLSEENLKAFEADIVFVCVPTPYNYEEHRFDGTIVHDTVAKVKDSSVVVIKSTVPPGTTQQLQEEFPGKKMMFNPEFLSEASCDADFQNPDRQFVGYTKESYGEALSVLNLLPESAYGVIMTTTEAEVLKYVNNMHGCLQVIEGNHFYDVAEKLGIDYKKLMKHAQASKWVGAPMGRMYYDVWHKGFRGFGGKCFPKDLHAWLDFCNHLGVDTRLMTAVEQINGDLLTAGGHTWKESEHL